MSVSIGDRIAEYEVKALLGSGGMGEVYAVRHALSGRMEAMKILFSGRLGQEEGEERFLREIQLLASVSHPNIAALHTAFRHQGRLFMIMELVAGATLRDMLGAGPLPVEQGVRYLREILAALAYAHAKGIIHRDLKPANVMIRSNDRVTLLDFGLAYNVAGSDITRTGSVLGSLSYMSPEQISGRPADARSDLYSLGIMLYQALTGSLPFEAGVEYAVARMHLEEVPADPGKLNPRIPAHLAAAILRLLSKAPADRFQSAQELSSALKDYGSADTGAQPLIRSHNPGLTSALLHPPGGIQTSTQVLQEVSGDPSLQSVTAALAHYIGSIAARIVQRAAARAGSLSELHAAVASEIDSDVDRESFLAAIRRPTAAP